MRIALGADHRGYKYKVIIKNLLISKNIGSEDFGTSSDKSCDYPDFGLQAAEAVGEHVVEMGIVICGTGNGMAMTANKVKGVRAALAINPEMARLARAHNDANMLVLSEMFTPEDQIEAILDTFLNTNFEGDRHARRVDKIIKYEKG
ncbi:MAG: RpiB/LacA/LacB family sugar-phosphate isomerase [candidate division Zixibacteria bacterium]|nr:RpiB/LacA/LacB family sugar-phosphate isomerase [candidate division Zixibacteria bacterium]